jgi:hypothetical protein
MDNATLQKNISAARARGVSEDLIQARVREIQNSQPTPEKKGFMATVGDVANKSFIEPMTRTLQTIAGTPFALGAAAFEKGGASPGWMENTAKAILPKQQQEDPRGALIQQLKDSASIGSWAVPFGKGANILTKGVLPGMAVGGLQEFGAGGTPEEIIRSTVGGGVTGGVLSKAGDVVSSLAGKKIAPLGKLGTKLEEAGTAARQKAAPVYQKASVYGASKEAAIQKTLDELGVKGTAAEKYKLLQPKMTELSGKIEGELIANPTVIKRTDIVKTFRENLAGALRRKELTSTQAQNEVLGYLSDIGAMGKEFSNKDLFALKKLVNEDYQIVAKKVASNTALTPREKVIQVARQTLDDAVTKANPEVKKLTIQQSHLFDAAQPLSTARKTVPTVRFMGTTLPGGMVQKGLDVGGEMAQKTGRKLQAGVTLPNFPEVSVGLGTQLSTRLPGSGATKQISPQGQSGQPLGVGAQGISSDKSISQSTQNVKPSLTGYTVDQLGAGMRAAMADGNTKAFDELKKYYDMEVKNQGLGGGATASIDMMEKLYAPGTSESLSMGENTVGLPGIASRGMVGAKKLLDQGYVNRLQSYNTQRALVAGAINKALGAGTLQGNEYQRLAMESFPNEYTSEQVAQDWFANAREVLNTLPPDRAAALQDAISNVQ